MKVRGWVYVMTNRAMPGLVKIGYSTKDPNLRARELESSGSPHPFEVSYDYLVVEPRELERRVHAALREHREAKEWFRCSVAAARGVIEDIIGREHQFRLAETPTNSSLSRSTSNPVGRSNTDLERPPPNTPCILKGYGCANPAASQYEGHWYCAKHVDELMKGNAYRRRTNKEQAFARIRKEIEDEVKARKGES